MRAASSLRVENHAVTGRLGCSENGERRATRLCVLMRPGYNDANGGRLLQVANKPYCSIDC